MDDYCTVTFTGTQGGTYYVACNLVEYISEGLVNTSSNSIQLYPAVQQGQQQTNITIPALSFPYYSSGQYRYYITDAADIAFNDRAEFYRERNMVEIVLMAVMVTIHFITIMIRRH